MLEPHEHAGLKLSLSEVMAMGELSEVEAMSQHELGRLLGLEKSTVSRLAAALERRGWIIREREPSNRRVYRLQLTDVGRTVADRLGEDLRAHHQQLLGALTPTEREGLTVGRRDWSASSSATTTSSHPQLGRTRKRAEVGRPARGSLLLFSGPNNRNNLPLVAWNTRAAYALTLHDR